MKKITGNYQLVSLILIMSPLETNFHRLKGNEESGCVIFFSEWFWISKVKMSLLNLLQMTMYRSLSLSLPSLVAEHFRCCYRLYFLYIWPILHWNILSLDQVVNPIYFGTITPPFFERHDIILCVRDFSERLIDWSICILKIIETVLRLPDSVNLTVVSQCSFAPRSTVKLIPSVTFPANTVKKSCIF